MILTWKGDIDVKSLQDVENIDDDVDRAIRRLDGTVLYSLYVFDEVVEVLLDDEDLNKADTEHGCRGRQENEHPLLQKLQGLVQLRLGRWKPPECVGKG